MGPKRSFLDRSAAQKEVDPLIRQAIEFDSLAVSVEKSRADATRLGAPPANDDLDADEVSRQIQEADAGTIASEDRLTTQEDMEQNRQVVQRQIDNILLGLNQAGTLPDAAATKNRHQAQRIACLQYLKTTERDASPQEQLLFPGTVVAESPPETLRAGDKYSEEHIMWALGSDSGAMVRDSWTVDEVFEALVSTRTVVEQVEHLKDQNQKLWGMVQQGQATVDDNFATLSEALQRIGSTTQRAEQTGQVMQSSIARLESNVQSVVDAADGPETAGLELKRRRVSTGNVQTAASSPIVRPRSSRALPTRRFQIDNLAYPPRDNLADGAAATGPQPDSAQQPKINITNHQDVDDVLSNILAWDGSTIFQMSDLNGPIVDKLKSQIKAMLSTMDEVQFRNAFSANVHKPGMVCVWERCVRDGKRLPNGYFACQVCVDLKRLCVVKTKYPTGEDSTKPHLAPLPVKDRAASTTKMDMGFWISASTSSTNESTREALAELTSESPLAPSRETSTESLGGFSSSPEQRRSKRNSAGSIFSVRQASHSPTTALPQSTSPPAVIPPPSDAPFVIADHTNVDTVFINIRAWDGSAIFPMDDLDQEIIEKLRAQIKTIICPIPASKAHQSLTANCHEPGMVCLWQRCVRDSPKHPNGYHACYECLAARRLCLLRIKDPSGQGVPRTRPHLAPLPDVYRPATAVKTEMAYYVLPLNFTLPDPTS
ncbi:hypothetical protein D6D15_04629 [Aureobasidium pullulans]|uniref:Uncharacterized protein n=1 Tax=Aureobasidium pullulans TaxID=5580 RepID=A0A4S9BDF7_AURPU|nr:hypothetical protein D6D15_04629 [Aureobasidium pullulans]